MDTTFDNMLSSANTSCLQALHVIIVVITCIKYNITAKLAHGLYHNAAVVEYNFNLKFLIIGNVK